MPAQPPQLSDWAVVVILIVFPLYFVGLWLLVTYVLARVGGWSRLAVHFPAPTTAPDGKPYPRRTLTARPVELLHLLPLNRFLFPISYSNCINVTLTPAGLYLKPVIFFRLRHPALLIPWEHVGSPVTKGFFVFKSQALPISANGVSWSLHLPKDAITEIETLRAQPVTTG